MPGFVTPGRRPLHGPRQPQPKSDLKTDPRKLALPLSNASAEV